MGGPKKKLKSDSSKELNTSLEFVYYNDFWFNKKEFNKIEKGLYLGSDGPIKDINQMEKLEVSHVITVKEEPVPTEHRFPNINYIHVEAGDFPDQDIITNFDLCFKEIDTALKNDEVVYVNCGGGVSRSATIVLAYIMKRYRISYSEAIRRVFKKRKVFPNQGFIDQLNLFERMEWMVNGFNAEYRRFLLKTLTYQLSTDGPSLADQSINKSERQIRLNFETKCVRQYFEKITKAEQSAQNCGQTADEGLIYYCYYCRTELFNENNIIGGNTSNCSNIFIEPLQTYCTQYNDQKTGYLKCPKCLIPFGSYNWLLYQSCCAFHQKFKECLAIKIITKKILF